MIGDDVCVAVGGMRIGRGNRTAKRTPVPVTLCPPSNLCSKRGHRGGKPATDLRHCTAIAYLILSQMLCKTFVSKMTILYTAMIGDSATVHTGPSSGERKLPQIRKWSLLDFRSHSCDNEKNFLLAFIII
jgi:hypothetical protein